MEESKTGTLSTKLHKIDAGSLRKAFVIHTIAGLFLCLAVAGFNLPIWIVVILGAVVMGSYYFQYYNGGQPTALLGMFSDSVYYLGFILTLISLVCSMLFFDIEEGVSSASVVISQFGAAMITTLMGMGIRIYLQNFDTTVETAELSARESLDETVKSFNVQMRRTNDTLSRLSESLNKNIKDTEERNNKSLQMFKETQKRLVSLGDESLLNFSKSSEKVISESLVNLDTLSKKISDKLSKVPDELMELSKSQYITLNGHITESLQVHFEKLTKQLVVSFEVASKSSQEFGSSMGAARASVTKFGRTAEDASKKISAMEYFEPDFQTLEDNQKAFTSNLKALSDEVATRTKSLLNSEFKVEEHIRNVTVDYKQVIESYHELISSSSAELLVKEEEKLLAAMKLRINSVEQLSNQWKSELQEMSKNSKAFSKNLIQTAHFITNEMTLSPEREAVNE